MLQKKFITLTGDHHNLKHILQHPQWGDQSNHSQVIPLLHIKARLYNISKGCSINPLPFFSDHDFQSWNISISPKHPWWQDKSVFNEWGALIAASTQLLKLSCVSQSWIWRYLNIHGKKHIFPSCSCTIWSISIFH